ncbi:MAG: Segregation and condensation protein A [Candidatus Uhrbacteria bacterium GW2011_GWA2_52_8d]|uniref:Segregation and condensation protein A n=1 Tax=Candidatus Uhrbacteria bacterium GW2011_GWA2_52_8d TaxID=1618979 RepID=A0A0G1XMS8_9BACT|nr:MAG: Segregation and condensation protein A [Candidatus Uhrbacteria bacterium GW2011_GWA2_52_8d]
MAFEVKLETFDGPLHVLLELIQGEELPITEVSLGSVTQKYLEYMNTHDVPPEELADFLVVATKLLLLKSQAILPIEAEPEEDPSTLALQLRLYKEFVDASRTLEERFDSTNWSFERATPDVVRLEIGEVVTNLCAEDLREAFSGLLKRLEPFFKLQTAALERVVSVGERLQEIHEAILSRTKMTFRQIASSGKSKVDVVISFLALLELVKQRVVHVVQSGVFDEIEIKRVD